MSFSITAQELKTYRDTHQVGMLEAKRRLEKQRAALILSRLSDTCQTQRDHDIVTLLEWLVNN